MADNSSIKTAIERTTKALTLKPSLGQSTGVSKIRITDGLSCEIQEGDWKLKADMPASVGGNNSGPTPGVYGRAAFGSCLAIGYMMKAASANISISSLEIEVQADYDDGAMFGTSAADPGYLQVRYIVTIETDAPKEAVMAMVKDADQHSPYLDVFSRAQDCQREIQIISPKSI